jgi:hypothetical protein
MRFFPKLLILLTSIALIPFFCVISYDWRVHKNFSTEISSYAGSLLIREASGMLEQAVEAYARLVKGQGETIETIAVLMTKIRSFCGSASQADDITMLMIRFNGPAG